MGINSYLPRQVIFLPATTMNKSCAVLKIIKMHLLNLKIIRNGTHWYRIFIFREQESTGSNIFLLGI